MSWTDEKMDALGEEVHEGFARMEVEFTRTNGRLESLETRTDARFEEVGRRFDQADRRFDGIEDTMKAGFDRMDAKFDAMHRLLFQVLCGLVGTLILALVTVISTH